MDTKETRRLRGEVCAPLEGEVVEIGFGTGLNRPHLPTTVARLRAVDPLTQGRKLAADRLAATDVPVDFVGLDGQELPSRTRRHVVHGYCQEIRVQTSPNAA